MIHRFWSGFRKLIGVVTAIWIFFTVVYGLFWIIALTGWWAGGPLLAGGFIGLCLLFGDDS